MIEELASALQAFPGVTVVETDPGGDTEPVHPGKRMDTGFGTWYVRFSIARTPEGWDTLERLAWIVNNDLQLRGARFFILPFAFPREVGHNADGECLYFVIEGGRSEDVPWLAEHLRQGLSTG
jgi:hypothetical protein